MEQGGVVVEGTLSAISRSPLIWQEFLPDEFSLLTAQGEMVQTEVGSVARNCLQGEWRVGDAWLNTADGCRLGSDNLEHDLR
jgi:hypothetical protein